MATEREFSCGGVVVRGAECIVIVPTRRAAGGVQVLALPKGHPEDGETPADAAVREVREEAGVEAKLVEKLGDVRYFYQRDGHRVRKVVAFFLFEHVSGDPALHVDEEVEAARWMPLAEAQADLTYPGDREVVKIALARLDGGDG
jgi:8-oxo-dGTP pyrophosphatase MutT (NUDIX family)